MFIKRVIQHHRIVVYPRDLVEGRRAGRYWISQKERVLIRDVSHVLPRACDGGGTPNSVKRSRCAKGVRPHQHAATLQACDPDRASSGDRTKEEIGEKKTQPRPHNLDL